MDVVVVPPLATVVTGSSGSEPAASAAPDGGKQKRKAQRRCWLKLSCLRDVQKTASNVQRKIEEYFENVQHKLTQRRQNRLKIISNVKEESGEFKHHEDKRKIIV